MTTQPEALRLADYLTDRNRLDLTCDEAAAELRRLHAENEGRAARIAALYEQIEREEALMSNLLLNLEREKASRQAAQIENEDLKARIARSGVEQQRAVLAERRNKWQPIETAPKDGSMFLCWVSAIRYGETDDGQQYQQDVSQPDFCAWRGESPDDGCWDEFCGQIGDSQNITHWMPIPPAPQQEGETQ